MTLVYIVLQFLSFQFWLKFKFNGQVKWNNFHTCLHSIVNLFRLELENISNYYMAVKMFSKKNYNNFYIVFCRNFQNDSCLISISTTILQPLELESREKNAICGNLIIGGIKLLILSESMQSCYWINKA